MLKYKIYRKTNGLPFRVFDDVAFLLFYKLLQVAIYIYIMKFEQLFHAIGKSYIYL